jgi:hypothetical protein
MNVSKFITRFVIKALCVVDAGVSNFRKQAINK